MSPTGSGQTTIDASTDPAAAVAATASLLDDGQVVVMPTDTVYGIAASAVLPAAVDALFSTKSRPDDRRIAVLVSDRAQAETLVRPSTAFAVLAERFWPGPLTLVATRREGSPTGVGDEATIGVRCPAHDLVRRVARRVGPLAVTSANLHGTPTPSTAAGVAAQFPMIQLVLDGGPCGGEPSTVVDITGPDVVVLRAGAVTEAEIIEALSATI